MDGKRRREYYTNKAKAEQAFKQGLKDKTELGRRWASLPPIKRLGIVSTLDEIERHGLTIQAVWQAYQAGRTLSTPPQDHPPRGD